MRAAFLLPEDSILCVTPPLLVLLDPMVPRCMAVHDAVDRYASVLEQLEHSGSINETRYNKSRTTRDKIAVAEALEVHRASLQASKTNLDVLNAYEYAVAYVFADLSAMTPGLPYNIICSFRIVPFTPACSHDVIIEYQMNAEIREFNRIRAGAAPGARSVMKKKG